MIDFADRLWIRLGIALGALIAVGVSPQHAAAQCGLTCPANVAVSNDPNLCSAVVTYDAPLTTGDCGTVTCAPPSGSTFPAPASAVTTVECSATGAPQPTCTFTVTVNDTQAPDLTCPSTQRRQGSGPVDYPRPTVTDNCPGLILGPICEPPSNSTFSIGNSSVNCSATDGSDNTGFCAFAVDVSSAAGAPAMQTTVLAALVAILGLVGAWSARRRANQKS
jgi:HYR domain